MFAPLVTRQTARSGHGTVVDQVMAGLIVAESMVQRIPADKS
jgi:hypothetical protein